MRRSVMRLAAVLGVGAFVLAPVVAHAAESFVPPTETPADEYATLSSASLQPEDVGSSFEIALIPNGTTVNGAPTLDLCGGLFPSEDLRTGRVQVNVRDPTTEAALISVESVSYRDAEAATQALDELDRARRSCPKRRFVFGAEYGSPPEKWKFLPAPDARWDDVAGVRRRAYDIRITEGQSKPVRYHIVYFQRGRYLIGLYGPARNFGAAAAPGIDGEAGLAAVLSERLAQLPAS